MSRQRAFPTLVGALMISYASASVAADATPEQAQAIAQTLETYFGKTPPGEAPLFTVTPKGQDYAFTLDLSHMLAPLAKSWLSFTFSPVSGTLSLQPDGKWLVGYSGDYEFAYSAPGVEGKGQILGMRTSEVFDPTVAAFVSGASDIGRLASQSTNSRPGSEMLSSRVTSDVHSDMTTVPKGPDAVTTNVHQTSGGTVFHVSGEIPAVDASIGSSTVDATLDGTRNRALLNLWAWFVAHPSADAVKSAQAELRPLVRAALPIFDHMEISGDTKKVSASFSGGKLAIDNASAGLDLNGPGASGSLTEKLSVNGIDLSVDAMPTWARSLVPRDLAMEVNVSGYDLAKAMETIVSNVDLEATPPLRPEVTASLPGDVLPSGTVLVRAAGVRLASDQYEVAMDGQIKTGPSVMPTGSMVVHAKGLDAVERILAEAAGTDRAARSFMLGLATAQGLAKVGADGVSTWEIVLGEDGQVTVNGRSLSAPAQPK